MIKIFTKKTALIAGAIVAVSLMSSQSWATSLTLNPAASSISGNEFLDVFVNVNDASDGIGAFNITINFDENILTCVDFQLMDKLGDYNDPGSAWDLSTGIGINSVNISELSLLSSSELSALQEPSFALAKITFQGLHNGISPLAINESAEGYQVVTNGGTDITSSVTTNGASVYVPEPSTLMLSLCGFLSLVCLVVKRKKTK